MFSSNNDSNTKEDSYALKFDLDTLQIEEDNKIIKEEFISHQISSHIQSILKGSDKIPIKGAVQNLNDKIFVHSTENDIYGIRLNSEASFANPEIVWNYRIKTGKILNILTPNIHENQITTKQSGGKIYYKYVDWNILLILSTADNKNLLTTVLKTDNGKVLYQETIKNLDFSQSILPIFEENVIVISYVRKEKGYSRNEIHVIEVMKRQIEHSLISLFERIFKLPLSSENQVGIDSQLLDIRPEDLVFLTQTFILPRKLKGLFISKSFINISNKFLILLLENNQVYFIDKNTISPRRPIVREDKTKPGPPVVDPTLNSPYIDPEMPPYSPYIVLDPKQILNINYMNDQISNIVVTPTEYESTFIVCIEGPSISCYKVYPDKTFDVLAVQFSYSLIIMFILSIMVF